MSLFYLQAILLPLKKKKYKRTKHLMNVTTFEMMTFFAVL